MKNKPAPPKAWIVFLPIISLAVALAGSAWPPSSAASQAHAPAQATGAFRIPF